MAHSNLGALMHPGAALLLSLLLVQPAVVADESSQDSEIEMLKRQVLDLQRRVERLEGELAQGVPVKRAREAEPVPGGWRKQHNWQLLTEGMTSYRVEEILGEPDRRKTVKKFEFWYYGDGKIRIYLRRLKSWEVPSTLDRE